MKKGSSSMRRLEEKEGLRREEKKVFVEASSSKAAEGAGAQGVSIKSFFNVRVVPQRVSDGRGMEPSGQEVSGLFRRGLGAKPETGVWSNDRRDRLDRIFAARKGSKGGRPQGKASARSLIGELVSRLRAGRQRESESSARGTAMERESGEPGSSHSKRPARRILIKQEDHLFQSVEYRGHFSRVSGIVTGRRPFARDETVGYEELDSEEEFEAMNDESIGSKEEGVSEEEGESGEDLMDGFVVPDECLGDNFAKSGKKR